MPKKTRGYRSVTVPVNKIDTGPDSTFATAAKDLGVTPESLERIIRYGAQMRGTAADAGLTPAETVSAVLNLLGEIISTFYDAAEHEALCGDVYAQLRASCHLQDH